MAAEIGEACQDLLLKRYPEQMGSRVSALQLKKRNNSKVI